MMSDDTRTVLAVLKTEIAQVRKSQDSMEAKIDTLSESFVRVHERIDKERDERELGDERVRGFAWKLLSGVGGVIALVLVVLQFLKLG